MKKMGMVLFLFGILFAGVAHADEVTLKNGDRLTGTIVRSDAKVLMIKSDFAGDVSIQWGGSPGAVLPSSRRRRVSGVKGL